MSMNHESSTVDIAKKKAKHLHSILKVRIPDISLGECLNTYARIEGARDWNTLSAALKAHHPTEDNQYKRLGSFIDSALSPIVMQIGSAYGMTVNAPSTYFFAKFDGDENVVHSRPSKELEVTFRPNNLPNTDLSFSIEVTPGGIYVERGEIAFVFPEHAIDIAVNILASKRMPHDLTPSLIRNTKKGEIIYSLILGIEPFFRSTEDGGIYDDKERIESIRRELDETVSKYAKLASAFKRLSEHLGNKKHFSSFETTLWEIFTDTPRFMSASSEFYHATFGDITLTASASKSGPLISGPGGSLNLGVSSIIYCEADGKKPAGYYIAKYGHDFEANIYLKGIAKEDILRITSEFGVPPAYELANDLGIPFEGVKDEYVSFYRSRAFAGLQEWVFKNRGFAKNIRHGAAYIPDWYVRATGQCPLPDSDEELIKEGRATRDSRLIKSSRKSERS